jgi:hypothetical protein
MVSPFLSADITTVPLFILFSLKSGLSFTTVLSKEEADKEKDTMLITSRRSRVLFGLVMPEKLKV